MSEQDIQITAALAGVALLITLADLLFSWWRGRGRARRASAGNEAVGKPSCGSAAMARREAIRRRLAAIEASSPER